MASEVDHDAEKHAVVSHTVQRSSPSNSSVVANSINPNDTPSPPILDDDDDDEYDSPPDGGLTAWLQVLASLLINALVGGYPSTFGVFQLYYTQTLHLPEAQASWIGAVQTFLTFATSAASGRFADAGYARQAVAAGTFLAVFGTFMTSLATTYWQIFLAQGVCTGLGLGIAFMPALSVLSSYFRKNRSFALTIAASGTSVGSVTFPATIQYLIPKIGFPWAVRCAGFVALAMALAANLLLRPRLPPRKSGPWFELAAFREPSYLLFALATFLYLYVLYFGFFYINSYATEIIGFSTTDSVNLLIITNAMGIPARPIVGYIADKYMGPINIFLLATLSVSVMLYAWTGVTTRTGMYIFCVVYGAAVGADQGTFTASLASLNKDPRKMGIRFGMIQTLCAAATVAGAPTAGSIIDRNHGNYFWAQIWGGTVMAMAFVGYTGCRIATTGWKLKVKI